jgi:transcription-repair coupling factor (superfamily II helicase)
MSLDHLVDQIIENYREQLSCFKTQDCYQFLQLPRSARLPILSAIWKGFNIPILLLTDRSDHALALKEELGLWVPDAPKYYFPEPNPLFYEKAPWSDTIRLDRLVALATLSTFHIPGLKRPESTPIITVPARALMSRTMPRREFLKATKTIKHGQKINLEQITIEWLSLGYERVNTVIAPGQFTKRGGILDLWPVAQLFPIRIELFGEEIDSLHFFDPSTQRTIKSNQVESPKKFTVVPACEVVTNPHTQTTTLMDQDEYKEFFLPLLYSTPATILDYLPDRSLILIDDELALRDEITEIEEQSIKLRKDAIRNGTITDNFPTPYLSWAEIVDTLQSHHLFNLGMTESGDILSSEPTLQFYPFTLGIRFGGRLKSFIEHLVSIKDQSKQIYIVSRQKTRLEELWNDVQPAIVRDDLDNQTNSPQSFKQGPPTITFIQGSLQEGWTLATQDQEKIYLFTDGEIFGFKSPGPRKHAYSIVEDPESAYADLQVGDFVVHIEHGIGIFVGLVSRVIDNQEREYLCIEYADEAQLFVPVYQADRITRYIGPDNRTPSLSHLGSQDWKNVKNHVKEAVQEVAQDLLELYVQRNIIQGHPFPPDTTWQQELEASFPYIETDDQIRVLNEVKRDMESNRPMDRLICGDVGYGKTEVALRASFKCILDNKQVAILVPTTILAQQHYDTFSQRLSAFPVVIDMLSRFRSSREQQQILSRLNSGGIDIIIGTHRLLSNDVSFSDLGLLIIDEEQRFGVTHKEKLKKMRTEVDVLTLTATPIPRTLYMSLTGVRDISNINTPPEERLPIITHVGPYTPELVRRAIIREIERGGQVFFVHNRVQTISAMYSHLEKLIPEAKITIVHGQMPENLLAERMKQFINGEIDVLLSTSIIESGLDIPNANTLIVDRADTFGLAQLYQLRGRVGRGAQRAYAYFFRHARRPLSQEGRQRLETIAENTQLGAGFSIAMRDLEIRGTGDVLGTRQSGHVAAVGFHLYTHLLAQAIHQFRELHKIPFKTELTQKEEGYLPVSVDLPFPVNIPVDYVAEKNMRLKLYRRLADRHSLHELGNLQEEFIDRFGPLPDSVSNMFIQMKIKILCEKAGLKSIGVENNQIALRYPNGKLPDALTMLDPNIRIGKTTIWLPYKKIHNWQSLLEETLKVLNQYRTEQSVMI